MTLSMPTTQAQKLQHALSVRLAATATYLEQQQQWHVKDVLRVHSVPLLVLLFAKAAQPANGQINNTAKLLQYAKLASQGSTVIPQGQQTAKTALEGRLVV